MDAGLDWVVDWDMLEGFGEGDGVVGVRVVLRVFDGGVERDRDADVDVGVGDGW